MKDEEKKPLIDKMDRVDRRDKLNEIKTPPATNTYRIKYEKINWNK
jgi:hypothetical protein